VPTTTRIRYFDAIASDAANAIAATFSAAYSSMPTANPLMCAGRKEFHDVEKRSGVSRAPARAVRLHALADKLGQISRRQCREWG